MTSTILPPGAVYALTDIRAHDVKYPGYNQVLVPRLVEILSRLYAIEIPSVRCILGHAMTSLPPV